MGWFDHKCKTTRLKNNTGITLININLVAKTKKKQDLFKIN